MRRLLLAAPMWVYAISQQQCLELVDTEARKYTNYPSTIKGIALAESSCGKHLVGDLKRNVPVTKASLGIMQFQLVTAREVMKTQADLRSMARESDVRLVTRLITDHALSIRLACLRFERHRKRYGWREAVSRHNGGRNNRAYVARIKARMRWVRSRR